MSQRFFAEAEGTAILGVGHRLANLVVRVLMSDPSYPWGITGLGKLAEAFPAKARGREHWIELARAGDLRRVAAACGHEAIERMADALVELRQSDPWVKLEEQRAVDFHRWRDESPYVARAVYSETRGTRTLSGLGAPNPDSTETREFIEAICGVSRNALDRLLLALVEIRESWLLAMEELSKGAIQWRDGTPGA